MPEKLPQEIIVSYKKTRWDKIKIGGILLLIFLFFFSGLFQQQENLNDLYLDENFAPLQEEPSSDAVKIGRIFLQGVIVSDSSANFFPGEFVITPSSVRGALADLLERRANMKALVINLSTPGGEVVASDEVAFLIKNAKKEIPVFVYTNDLMASGGYYIASQSTKIWAHPLAQVGSIGVIGQFPNISELAKNIGISMETYKAGKHKDLENPFRARSEEEKQLIQEMIDEAYEVFKNKVQEGRGMTKEQVEKIATGEIWSGKIAKGKGLLDDVFYWDGLSSQLKKELGVEKLYYYERVIPKSFFEELISSVFLSYQQEPLKKLAQNFSPLLKQGIYYYWY